MKKTAVCLVALLFVSLFALAFGTTASAQSFAGRYVGYSWQGEARGVALEDANQRIETILELNDEGIITSFTMRFWVRMDGFWTTRQSGNAYVAIDFAKEPTFATLDNQRGQSMFTIYTADRMSLYALGVDELGVVAVAMVCPVTRYQFESRFPVGFDYGKMVSELTMGNGLIVPTFLTSGGAFVRPQAWSELEDKTLFTMHPFWSHVVNTEGVLAGITHTSTVEQFLVALGVTFVEGRPQPLAPTYGYFGIGGWKGNYDALAKALIGQDARKTRSLVDWSNPMFRDAVNENRIFGVDVQTGATRTVQNSYDTISGATVRISRESTSYQRALVEAGILTESEVIIGRF